MSLRNKQIKILLAPLKRKDDAVIPSRKADMLIRLTEWEARGGYHCGGGGGDGCGISGKCIQESRFGERGSK